MGINQYARLISVDPMNLQQKQIKKEIQRLVTILMQKEGRLKENQEFT